MKFPFLILLFVILLVSLLLISYYGFTNRSTEGFISFNANKNPLAGDIIIPTYSPSSRIFKLYDNLFFDNTNGNLIQANGVSLQGNTTTGSINTDLADTIGKSLTSVIVYNRDSSVGSVTIDTQITNGTITNAASAQSQKAGYDTPFSQFMISSNNADTTDNYQTLYVSWDKYTFIDVINTSVSPPQTLLGALFSETELRGNLLPVPLVSADTNNITIVPAQYVADSNDGKTNTQSWYGNNRLYQISSFLYFDTANGNMVLKTDPGASANVVTVLDRNFNQVKDVINVEKYIPSVGYTVRSVQFTPINSAEQQYFIYYVGFGQRTIIIVLRKQVQSSDMFKIVSVSRFDNNGYVEPKSKTVEPSDADNTERKNKRGKKWGSDYEISEADMDLLGVDFLLANQIDYIQQNYVKKTDMVPPIYPTVLSCSTCNGNSGGGVCNNCGGNGGSGTSGISGNTTASGLNSGFNTAFTETAGLGKEVVGGTVGLGKEVVGGAVGLGKDTLDLGKQAVTGTVDLGKETVGGAVDLTKEAVSGVAGATEKVVGGTVNLGREVVGGAVGLGKDVVGGAVDLTKQAATGAVNELNYLTTIRNGPGVGGVGGYGVGGTPGGYYYGQPGGQQGTPIRYNTSNTVPGVDNHSGYGALVPKGDDFMPLTASFSAFGK